MSEAFVCTQNVLSRSGICRIGEFVKLSLKALNACSCDSPQLTWFGKPFFVKSVSGTATEAKLGMYFRKKPTKLKNVCNTRIDHTKRYFGVLETFVWCSKCSFLLVCSRHFDLMVTHAEIQFQKVCIFRHFSKDIFWLWHWFYIQECYLVDVPEVQATMVLSSIFLHDHH